LVVGHSEHSLTTYHRFQACNYANAILYQRTEQPSFLPQGWEQPTALVEKKRVAPVPAPAPADVQPDVPPVAASQVGLLENGDSIEQARELLNYGRSEQARDLLLEMVNQTPRHATACVLLGQAYANLSCWQDAERWCHQAVRLDKLALDAYYTLALVLQHQGKLNPAIEAMKKVIYIDRNHVLGHFGLANLYRSNGQVLQALKSLDNARRLLNGHSREEVVPNSGGITVGRLRATVIHLQQRLSVESAV